MALTQTIKVTISYSDLSTKTFSLPGITDQDFNVQKVKEKINAYNELWGCKLPDDADKADLTGYEEYAGFLKSILISDDGGQPVSIASAQTVAEEEVTIYNG